VTEFAANRKNGSGKQISRKLKLSFDLNIETTLWDSSSTATIREA
jgi:hypothetical protein